MKKTRFEKWIKAITGKSEKDFSEDPAKIDRGKIKLALLKENYEYRKWFDDFKPELLKKEGSRELRIENVWLEMTLNPTPPLSRADIEDIQNFFDPKKDVKKPLENGHISQYRSLFNSLDIMFLEKGIQVEQGKGLMPYEISMKIDLRKRKKQIRDEFEFHLGQAFEKLKTPHDPGEWKPDISRSRKEILLQLEIWKMHKEMSFREIEKKLKMNKDLLKKHFYRAWELTQRKPYDRDEYIKQSILKLDDLPYTCKNCPDKKCVETGKLCPRMAAVADQDKVYQRERSTDNIEAIYASEGAKPRKRLAPLSLWDRQQKNGPVKIYRPKDNPTD